MSTPTRAPAPGWYPDPAGTNRRRWWDGRAWTDFFADGGWDGAVEQQPLAAGTRVNTLWIWLLVLALPVVQLVVSALEITQQANDPSLTHPGVVGAQVGLQLGAQGLSLLFLAVTVVLALLDWRRLRAIGVVKPFHWAYAFIPAPVYIIGRTVVLRRRVRQGMAPLWAWIVMTVISFVVIGIEIAHVVAVTLPQALSSANA